MSNNYTKPLVMTGAAAIALTAVSCAKYEDGPSTSLVSKDNRLCRQWSIDEYDGYDISSYGVVWEFEKGGNWSQSMSYYGSTYTYTGTWEWNSDKSKVFISEGGSSMNCDISRLTTEEFWFDMDGSAFKASAK